MRPSGSRMPFSGSSVNHGVWCMSLFMPFLVIVYELLLPVERSFCIISHDFGEWQSLRLLPIMLPYFAKVAFDFSFMYMTDALQSQIVTAKPHFAAQSKSSFSFISLTNFWFPAITQPPPDSYGSIALNCLTAYPQLQKGLPHLRPADLPEP